MERTVVPTSQPFYSRSPGGTPEDTVGDGQLLGTSQGPSQRQKNRSITWCNSNNGPHCASQDIIVTEIVTHISMEEKETHNTEFRILSGGRIKDIFS
jgi:hypothetical protein